MMSRDVLWERAPARECCVQPLHTPTPWMPDQVGHDSFQVVGRAYLSVIPAKAGIHVSVMPEYAGVHVFKTWMPDQVGHDSFEVIGHDGFWGEA